MNQVLATMARPFAAGLLSLASIGHAASDAALEQRARLAANLNTVLDAAVAQKRIVGAVVLVAQDGAVLYRQAVGYADREAQRPMQASTGFRLASMTKPIVTLAAMRLVESGKLQLDAPVTRYLPDFRPPLVQAHGEKTVPTLSVRQLITHTSGLGYGFAEEADGAYARLGVSDGLDSSGISLDENLRRLGKAPLYFAPGSQWRYSLGIDVLGAVVAKAGGAPLQQVVARSVTHPLQMQHTRFAVRPGTPLAVPYADGKPQPVRMHENMVVPLTAGQEGGVRFSPKRAFDRQAFASGGAGMVGNADDYLQLLESVRRSAAGQPGLLQPGTVQEMVRDQVGPQAQTQGPGWGFGLGWAVLVDPALAGTPQGKGSLQWGGAYGHNWFVDPERRLSVILLTNTAFEGMAGQLVNEVRDAVYASL